MIKIDIKVDDREARRFFKNVQKRLPKEIGTAAFEISNNIAGELRKEVVRQGLIWRGKLHKAIEARKVGKMRSGVFMPRYGVALDSMRPHIVALKRGRKITKWAADHGLGAGAIRVHPHPFIDVGVKRGLKGAARTVVKRVKKALRK